MDLALPFFPCEEFIRTVFAFVYRALSVYVLDPLAFLICISGRTKKVVIGYAIFMTLSAAIFENRGLMLPRRLAL